MTGNSAVLWFNLFGLAFTIFVLVDALIGACNGEKYGWRFAGVAAAMYVLDCASLINYYLQ